LTESAARKRYSLIIFNKNLLKALKAMSTISQPICCALAIALLSGTTTRAQETFSLLQPPQTQIAPPQVSRAYSPRLQSTPGDENENPQLPARLQRQIVTFPSHEVPGTVIIDTANTFLYYILGSGRAIRYGIGVGREGFTWSGVKSVARKAEWPDWYPPAQMIGRQPYLPRMVAGGPGNPLGARAIYIGGTEYRIHGTNDPTSIGKRASSGCIRLVNDDVIDLYNRITLGAKVIVLSM
jgi:lipoprotein-anchoring transpeptidase ErfK/SrfK